MPSLIYIHFSTQLCSLTEGGWVMPDEANSHYAALVEQLIHGKHLRDEILDPASHWPKVDTLDSDWWKCLHLH